MKTKPEIFLSYCVSCGTVQVQAKGIHATKCFVCDTVREFAPVVIDFEKRQFITVVESH